MKDKLINSLLSICLLQSAKLLASDAGAVLDIIPGHPPEFDQERINLIFDRQGYENISADDEKSPFNGDWSTLKSWLKTKGDLGTAEGADRNTGTLRVSPWPLNTPFPSVLNADFVNYRNRMESISEYYSKISRSQHPWDAVHFINGAEKDFESQILCLALPFYSKSQSQPFVPSFIAARVESVCQQSQKIRYPALAHIPCLSVENSDIPGECVPFNNITWTATDSETLNKIEAYAGQKWINEWSQDAFDSSGRHSHFAFPFQHICMEEGFVHGNIQNQGKADLAQFSKGNFIPNKTLFDRTSSFAHPSNLTDWTGINLACNERFAEIIFSTKDAIADLLHNPKFGQSAWLDSMIQNIANDFPAQKQDANKISTEFITYLTKDFYSYINGYSQNAFAPGIELNRDSLSKAVSKKAKGAEVLMLMLALPEGKVQSPWRKEFELQSEDNRKKYLSILIREVTASCPLFGNDTITDVNCLTSWLAFFDAKQTPRIEIKKSGKSIGFVRYGFK